MIIKNCAFLSLQQGLQSYGCVKILLCLSTLVFKLVEQYCKYDNLYLDAHQIAFVVLTVLDVAFTGLLLVALLLKNKLLVKIYLVYVLVVLGLVVVYIPYYFYDLLQPILQFPQYYNMMVICATTLITWTVVGLQLFLALAVYSYLLSLEEDNPEGRKSRIGIMNRL